VGEWAKIGPFEGSIEQREVIGLLIQCKLSNVRIQQTDIVV